MKLRCEKSGFTLVEILAVLGIITLLTGVLVATGTVVRKVVREAKQRAQLVSIEQGLLSFRGDYGDYPPSNSGAADYCGAQVLAEALLGWDLLGFHPDSHWQADGKNNKPCVIGGVLYPSDGYFFYDATNSVDMDKRREPYLEHGTENAFRVGDLFRDCGPLAADRFVICDSFGVRRIMVGGQSFKAGAPILYYKANPSSKTIRDVFPNRRIYNVLDNERLVNLGSLAIGEEHPLQRGGSFEIFYDYIEDPKATAASGIAWPYRPDSYILISAGADGLYGTSDDITNFGN